MYEAISTIIVVIVSSIIIAPLLNKSMINAKFHNTIDWRNELYKITISDSITKNDLRKIQSLISPISESTEDIYINLLCIHLIDNFNNAKLSTHKADIQYIGRLLLKLNWIKHGTISGLRFPLHFHLLPNYIRSIYLAKYICDLIANRIDRIDTGILKNVKPIPMPKWLHFKLCIINFFVWTIPQLIIVGILLILDNHYNINLWNTKSQAVFIFSIGISFLLSIYIYCHDYEAVQSEISLLKKLQNKKSTQSN